MLKRLSYDEIMYGKESLTKVEEPANESGIISSWVSFGGWNDLLKRYFEARIQKPRAPQYNALYLLLKAKGKIK